ncbi:MAG: molybdopterin molybdotransferase MoeA [Rhodocyclaceae bacterium]|nr:molybdopterin molybdotransferase MoeA [Rhodocyclaceae bacterium]
MLSFAEALERLLAEAPVVSERRAVPLLAARGRVLAETQYSTLTVPPLDNAAMDGYAVHSGDISKPGTVLPVTQRIPAGSVGAPLTPGTAARIFTGAPIPPGADAVVMQELCEVRPDGAVCINELVKAGQNIRRAGEDIAAGTPILAAGTRLGPAHLGLAASVGLSTLPVYRRLRVALMATGDELVEPGEALQPGQIYNANRYFLRPLLEGFGCEVNDLGRIPDALEATRQAIRQAAADNDLIVSSGGVSVGEEDHVKAAVEAEGRLELWKIAIKPGKPLAFGKVGARGTAFIGLPGNPVASFITCLMLVRPFVLKRMGVTDWQPRARSVIAASAWPKPDRRREFLRARLDAAGCAELYPNQGSGVLSSCVWAEGFIDNPPGQSFSPGDAVSFIPLADLLE